MSATILIVEDEYAVARGIQYALEQEGYQVTVAGSGEEALEVAAELARQLREPVGLASRRRQPQLCDRLRHGLLRGHAR